MTARHLFAAEITLLFGAVAFLAIALLTQQTAFYGVVPAFLTLGIVFIATSRSKRG